jgi:tetratricopeptide (TPR) repeat protein
MPRAEKLRSHFSRAKRVQAMRIIIAAIGIVIICAILWCVSPTIRMTARVYVEAVKLYLHPSGALAYAYGVEHFSDTNPQGYDLNAAKYFFKIAARDDPSLPDVYLELARIEFLNGDFQGALALIDTQILNEGDKTPNAYYMRGLIEGFIGDYPDSERDYAHFLTFDPIDWAGVNDYSWVLLKDGKPKMADAAISAVLKYFPNNPWLLNSDAIALSEMGDISAAKARILAASAALSTLTPLDWSNAYPGNDPAVAEEGLAAFKTAVENNMHSIESGTLAHAVQ